MNLYARKILEKQNRIGRYVAHFGNIPSLFRDIRGGTPQSPDDTLKSNTTGTVWRSPGFILFKYPHDSIEVANVDSHFLLSLFRVSGTEGGESSMV